jgi:hypothetical protein
MRLGAGRCKTPNKFTREARANDTGNICEQGTRRNSKTGGCRFESCRACYDKWPRQGAAFVVQSPTGALPLRGTQRRPVAARPTVARCTSAGCGSSSRSLDDSRRASPLRDDGCYPCPNPRESPAIQAPVQAGLVTLAGQPRGRRRVRDVEQHPQAGGVERVKILIVVEATHSTDLRPRPCHY